MVFEGLAFDSFAPLFFLFFCVPVVGFDIMSLFKNCLIESLNSIPNFMNWEGILHKFMNKFGSTISERLAFVVGDRKIHPWAKSIGVSKGTIESVMNKGGMPGAETLGIIRRAENVRIDWLLEGRGTPFYVAPCASDQAAASLLDELLSEEQWEVTVVSDHHRLAFVLSQPGSHSVKDQFIDYTIVEVIVGPLGPASILTLRKRNGTLFYTYLDAALMEQLEKGEIGTYKLFDREKGLLNARVPIDVTSPVFDDFKDPSMPVVAIEEVELLLHYRMLDKDKKQAVQKIISAMTPDPDEGELPAPSM